jgi:hypothetical protein
MVEGIHKNITFYKVFKVFFRIYGLYLIITGLMSSLAIVPYIIKIYEMKDTYWITRYEEAFNGLGDLFIGLILLLMSKFFSKKMVGQEIEITLNESSLFDLALATLRLLLVIALISHMSVLLVSLIIFSVLTRDANDLIMVVIPMIFTIINSILLIKSRFITALVIK